MLFAAIKKDFCLSITVSAECSTEVCKEECLRAGAVQPRGGRHAHRFVWLVARARVSTWAGGICWKIRPIP